MMLIGRSFAILTLVFAALVGCKRQGEAPAPPPASTATQAEASSGERDQVDEVGGPRTFGGPHLGFVDFLERDARFVVLHRFTTDTDGDGTIDPKLGDHGEPTGDQPTVVVVDLRTGAETEYDELLTTDPRLQFVTVRKGPEVFIVRASGAMKLQDADPRPDASPCMPARQVSIDPGGNWIAYPRANPDRAVMRNVETGEEREFQTKHDLWRVDPTPMGWAMLREIPEDTDGDGVARWPRRKGSCVCRWCGRFAKSHGAGGFVGDEFRSTLITPDGRRLTTFSQPLPITDQHVWSLVQHRLFDREHKVVSLGPAQSCRPIAVPLETGKLVTRCGGEYYIWDPITDESLRVKEKVEALDMFVAPIDGWIGVRVDDGSGAKNVGRLNIEDGRVEVGPAALRIGAAHASGWVLVADAASVHAFHIGTGVSQRVGPKGGHLLSLVFKHAEGWRVVDPATGKTQVVKDPPAFVAANGCFIPALDSSRPIQGPFELRCIK